MAGLGRGAIIYNFVAVCGGCERRQPLQGDAPYAALADAVAKKWGETPTLGLVCPRCVKKIAEGVAQAAREAKAVVLTDERGNPLEGEEANGSGDN